MDLQFYGANCVTVSIGGTRLVIDDNLVSLGGKSVTKTGDVALFTTAQTTLSKDARLNIDTPGEYEIADISIYGIPVRAHMDEDKQRTAIMYKLISKEIRLLIVGHIFPKLNENDLETIGTVDVLVIPVGGNGFTLDPIGAMEVVKEIEPKLIIPTYYDDPKLNFPVPAQTLDQALQGLALEPKERVSKLRLKSGDFSETMQLVILDRQ